MSKNGFEFMQHNIQFYDNSKINQKGFRSYGPLFKVIYPLYIMIKGVIVVWTDRRHVTIDDSMINYMKRAISYVLYHT